MNTITARGLALSVGYSPHGVLLYVGSVALPLTPDAARTLAEQLEHHATTATPSRDKRSRNGR